MNADTIADALLPCPFCGTKPEIDYTGNDATPKRKVVIRCPECCVHRTDAALRHSMKWLESVAVRNWNRRAQPAQAAQPVGVPDGWVMVPSVPTFDMVAAIGSVMIRRYPRENFYGHAVLHEAATAMLTAAPQPPSIDRLGKGHLVRTSGDVDQGVPVSASRAQKEALVVVDVGLDSAEHDLKSAVLAGPHDDESTPSAPDGIPNDVYQLARRCLWIAFVWNDHNFEAANIEARKEAAKHGIHSFDDANDWMDGLDVAVPQPPAQPSADAEDAALWRFVISEKSRGEIDYAVIRVDWSKCDGNLPRFMEPQDVPEIKAAMAQDSDAARAAEGDA